MAERIVSPGVFTREKDLSFLPAGIAQIGAAVIGPTVKGPAFVPTTVTTFSEFKNIFGGEDKRFYVPYTVREYIKNAPSVTIVRVLGIGGYRDSEIYLGYSGSVAGNATGDDYTSPMKIGAVLKPSRGSGSYDLGGAGETVITGVGDGNILIQLGNGTNTTYSASLNPASNLYVTKVFTEDPQTVDTPIYVYKHFEKYNTDAEVSRLAGDARIMVSGFDAASLGGTIAGANSYATGALAPITGLLSGSLSASAAASTNFQQDYSEATTPFIQSQIVGSSAKNLFKIKTRSHGTSVNEQYKIEISDVQTPAEVGGGAKYGNFTLRVLINDKDDSSRDGQEAEPAFTNCTFDPLSNDYLPKKIGDRHITIDSNGKLSYNGDWPNKSTHIRLCQYDVIEGIDPAVLPFGFQAVKVPITGSTNIPTASFKIQQTNSNGSYDANVAYGFNFSDTTNQEYLDVLPALSQSNGNVDFKMENMFGHADAANGANGSTTITLSNSLVSQRKFLVPFQGGFDGDNPTTLKAGYTDITSTNTQGFDLSSTSASGSIVYKRAINAVSNPDEFDINLLAIPGVNHQQHSEVTNHAISKTEARSDTFYVMDGSSADRSVRDAVSDINSLDTNYAGTYYPWVQIIDGETALPVWVPPSVVIPGVISFTDSVSHEWFAPAGLNRGGLNSVVQAKTRLTHTERDELYSGRVNPIASFPGQGVVVFGQKTLQGKASALDRINVRRLLIRLRQFIASSSRYLLFEQNTDTTRNRFLNIVNPFLNSVQQNSGLSAFKVVMDESNNTADVVDRNQLVGQIFIQPTRTAEFIVLDFIIQPTGAAFPE